MDQIFVLNQLVEIYIEKKELYGVYIDIKKTYDEVSREELWRVLYECGVEDYLVRSMSSLYDGVDYIQSMKVEWGVVFLM